MEVKFKKYKMLDGSYKTLVEKVGDGSIIRRFEKTAYPENPDDVVCPHFMEMAWSWGCPYDCKFCYLKGTYRFFIDEATGRVNPHFKDRNLIFKACRAFILSNSGPEILNCGELSDSLMGEALKPEPWSVFIQRIFQGSKHKILYLSKGLSVKNFLDNDWTDNAILAWSVNEPSVSAKWEYLAPDPISRLDAAKEVYEAGYEVRLRIDPIVPVLDYQAKYQKLVDEIFNRLSPERITLGTLRGLASTLAHTRNHSWKVYLENHSGWGRKPAFKVRLAMYQTLIDYLNNYGFHRVGICKETLALWQALGLTIDSTDLRFDQIICNCVA